MAMNTKTTVWAIASNDTAEVASAVQRTFAATTIYVPETTSRTFRSAIVELCWADASTVAASITAISGGLTVNATRTTDATVGTFTNSGEATCAIVQLNFTANVQAQFGAGASQSMQFDLTITGIATRNVSATLRLTYDYDDDTATLIKTVMIPLDSDIDALPTTLGSIGTNQIPILTGASGICKENTPVIRDYFFVLTGNENLNADTTDVTLAVALDSDGETAFGVTERAFGSDRLFRIVWSKKGAVPDTTATHDFKAYCGTASHHHMSILLVVTYEFTRVGTTAALNSVQIPFYMPHQGATTVGDAQVIRIPIDIQEPDTIALVQSGIEMYWSLAGAMTTANYLTFKVGAQAERSYTSNVASGSLCGALVAGQRFDSGSAGGTGMTIGRGQRYVDVYVYTAAQRSVFGITGILYLNYTSGAVAATVDRHNKTTSTHIIKTSFTPQTHHTEVATTPFATLAATAYWLQAAALWSWWHFTGTTGTQWIKWWMESLTGDGVLALGDGWQDIAEIQGPSISETGTYAAGKCSLALFKRHPGDPQVGRATITTSRKYRYISPRGTCSMYSLVTWHGLTFTVTGAVTGFAGSGDVTVRVHDDASGEYLYAFTASVGGSYTATIYDSVRDHFAEVFEDTSHVGRSGKWKAA